MCIIIFKKKVWEMLRYNNHSQAYKSSLSLLANKSKLVKSLKGTWRQKKGYLFELYGHEILLANGIRYKGNPILPSEWLKDDAVKSRDQRHADFETEDRELEFKHNEYYLKPSHFCRDILPRFKDPKKKWTLVVLDKNKCVYIMELIKYYHIELWDLEEFRKYCEQKAKETMGEESSLGCMGERGVLHCRMLLTHEYLSSDYSSSFHECMIKEHKTIKTRFRDLLPICRIHSCLVYMLNRRPMNKDTCTNHLCLYTITKQGHKAMLRSIFSRLNYKATYSIFLNGWFHGF
jgi:hypothetical protein